MRIFFDTNFIVNLIVETDFSEKVRKIVEKYADEDIITSISAVEDFVHSEETYQNAKRRDR